MAISTVYAEYDPAGGVWLGRASDMPGLPVDAQIVDEFACKTGGMIVDLPEIKRRMLDDEAMAGPQSISIVAHDDRAFPVAA